MLEREVFTPHPRGLIRKAEVPAIVASAEQFLSQKPAQRLSYPEPGFQTFPEAPLQLIRRFYHQQPGPQDGESWIPWGDLPSDLFWRASVADECKRRIYQAHQYNEKTGESNLTPEMVQGIFERERPRLLRSNGSFAVGSDFDLHDVYVCAEATLMEFYAKREHYSTLSTVNQKVNEQLLAQFQATLTVIGHAIPPIPDQDFPARNNHR